MKKTIFIEKRKLTPEELNAKMDFQAIMNLFFEAQAKPNVFFDAVPMEDFEQITFQCTLVLNNGDFVNEVQFLTHSAN